MNEHVDQLTTLSKAKGFLGREFLTWLWYTAETSKERQKVPGRGKDELELDLWIDDRIALEGTAAMSHHNVMKGGDPSHSREAAASLVTGKTVRELKIGLNIKGIGEFSAVLNCDDLNPRGLKLPQPGDEGGTAPATELPLMARLQAMEIFLAALDGLFAKFLTLRCEDEWEKTGLVAMREWIKTRHNGEESGRLH